MVDREIDLFELAEVQAAAEAHAITERFQLINEPTSVEFDLPNGVRTNVGELEDLGNGSIGLGWMRSMTVEKNWWIRNNGEIEH